MKPIRAPFRLRKTNRIEAESKEVSFAVESISLRRQSVKWIDFVTVPLLILLGSWGFQWMMTDALGLQPSVVASFLPVPILVALAVGLTRSRKTLLFGGAAVLLGGTLFFLLERQNPLMLFARSLLTIWNRIQTGVDAAGYVSFPVEGFSSSVGDDELVVFLAICSVLLLSLCLFRKVRLFPVLLYFIGTAVPLFSLRMIEDSIGVALIVVCACSVVVMGLWEKQKCSPPSGVGLLCLVLAASILLVPLTAVRKPLGDISMIQDGVKSFIEIVGDLYRGVGIFDLFSQEEEEEGYRTARSSPRKYRGVTMVEVYADTDSMLYLREFDGGYYDYQKSRWKASEVDPAIRVSVTGYSLSTKGIQDEFFELFSKLECYPDQFGFVQNASIVLVNSAESKSVLTPVGAGNPRAMENSPIPVMNRNGYWELESELAGTYSFQANYSVDRGGESAYRFRQAVTGYSAFLKQDKQFKTNSYYQLLQSVDKTTQSQMRWIASTCQETAKLHYAQQVDSDAIDSVLDQIFRTTDLYRYFNVKVIPESNIEAYRASHPNLGEENGSFLSYDARVKQYTLYECKGNWLYADEISRIISSYLKNNYYYSLNPPKSQSSDAMEAFLLDKRQGYCVQFATAGTLMLRRLGYVARYVEGYIASDFIASENSQYGSAVAKVLDNNAHAWTEVWVDGFGWMVCEMTPGYSDQVYQNPLVNPDGTEPLPTDPDPWETYPEETYPEETYPEETYPEETGVGTPDPKEFPWAVVGIGAGAILLLVVLPIAVVWLSLRAIRHRMEWKQKVSAWKKEPLSKEDNRSIGDALLKETGVLLSVCSLSPQAGEMPRTFASRVKEAFPEEPLADPALQAMIRQVYAGGMSREELGLVSEFLRFLNGVARKKLGFFRYHWYRDLRQLF